MYRSGDGAVFFSRRAAGKASTRPDDHTGEEQEIPCGKCTACQITYIREWTGRCLAENLVQQHGHFVTLTYRPELQPLGLVKEDLQKFLKRLRYHHGEMRYYAVGEYGEKGGKAHFHMCYWPKNQIRFGEQVARNLWTSPEIGKAWDLGYHSVSHRLESGSIRYVIGYVQKKLRVKEYCTDDGEILARPFALMSQSLGKKWILENQEAIAKAGFLPINGKRLPVSKDMIKLMRSENQTLIEKMRYEKRRPFTQKNLDDLEINLKAQKRNSKL